MNSTLLDISGVSVSLGGKSVLANVSLSVKPGEWVSIAGKNGAGKSTLLKCIMRIVKCDAGSMVFGGTPLSSLSQRALARQIAYVPQATGRYSPFSVYEHVMLARYPYLKPFSAPSKFDRKMVLRCLDETGLLDLKDRFLSTLSGGERQKVYLAQAFAQEAKLLLLDEPNTFLDPRCVQEVLQLLKGANRERGITIISVTHDINSAAVVSDRILALKDGLVEYEGDSASFMEATVLERVYNTAFSFVSHPQNGLPLVLPWQAV
ncbi:MAG: ABC transporter ATP-binding protein [Deltaproteobacteria bacterium]|nr:ABC transporter ATP-binding protein [Deltaproteobacteria bacterium]MBN2674506.1 ABC transporter ATP-binding protein [Deltaproteobacteria bacterium]